MLPCALRLGSTSLPRTHGHMVTWSHVRLLHKTRCFAAICIPIPYLPLSLATMTWYRCSHCHCYKPATAFGLNSKRPDKRRQDCKQCNNQRTAASRARSTARRSFNARLVRAHLLRAARGLTPPLTPAACHPLTPQPSLQPSPSCMAALLEIFGPDSE